MELNLTKIHNRKKLINFDSPRTNNPKTKLEISKLQTQLKSLISKEFRSELMPSIISLTNKIANNCANYSTNNDSNQLIRSYLSSYISDNESSNPLIPIMIHNSLFSISKQIIDIHNYMRLNQSFKMPQIRPNRGKGRRKFIIINSLPHNSNNHSNQIRDEYDLFHQSSRETIDQLYKKELSQRKRAKQLSSFSTQTPFMISQMHSKSLSQMEFNYKSKRPSLPEENFIRINKVKLKPMMSRIISRNLYNYLSQ